MILLGDSLLRLKELPENSVDAVVTDPPYGLAFMGKKWDYDVPSVELWREVMRVLKPGGHVLSFGGTRTYHRMVCAIEDAGFEIRDQVQWIYGSGFPKSHDVSKGIDKQNGDERPVVGLGNKGPNIRGNNYANVHDKPAEQFLVTSAASAESRAWQGWGTALKPANEPICLARKPLEKGLTVAQNVLKWGCGAINVDGGRIGTETRTNSSKPKAERNGFVKGFVDGTETEIHNHGRWPANVLFDKEAAQVLDEQSGVSPSNSRKNKGEFAGFGSGKLNARPEYKLSNDSGGASRFFYVAKASKRERNAGLEDFPLRVSGGMSGTLDGTLKTGSGNERNNLNQNSHPTVKPIKLMQYLCRLITPPGGTILDPFMGSGSTGVAAKSLGFEFIGIELSEEYFKIAERRIEAS